MSMETESPAPLLQYSSVLRRHLQALQQLGAYIHAHRIQLAAVHSPESQ